MSLTSTNYLDFSYVKETVPGTTPATPTFQRLPVTGVGLNDNLTTSTSNVIRPDRQTDDLIVTDASVNGDNNFELSYEALKPILVSSANNGALNVINIVASDLVAAAAGTIVSTTTNFVASGCVVGAYVKAANFDDAENDLTYKITAVSTNSISVSPSPGVDGTGAGVTLKGSYIRNGNKDGDSYTFRRQLNKPGSPTAIFYYRGCQIGDIELSFQTSKLVEGKFGVTGLTGEGTSTPFAGETLVDIPTYDIMNAVTSLSKLEVIGLTAVRFSSLTFKLDNGIEQAKALGVLGAADLEAFTLNCMSEVELYFEDLSLYNAYKGSTAFSLAFGLQDTTGNQILIDQPHCKFESLTQPTDGKDKFLTETGTIKALRHPTEDYTIQYAFIDA